MVVLFVELFFILLVEFNYLLDLIFYEFPSGRWELEISFLLFICSFVCMGYQAGGTVKQLSKIKNYKIYASE